jgi:type IV pilus assembly protein PilN
MHISLNLATRPFTDLGPSIKRLRIAMAVLALIAIALGICLHVFHRQAEEARARDLSLDSQIARITKERQDYQNLMRQTENAQLMVRIGALNQLFDEKTFSWTLAMEDLETVLPGGVQVSTLEPVRAKDGSITLRLRVLGPRDLAVNLVRNLEHSKHFLLPRIVGENAESSSGPNEKLEPVSASNRVNFDLLADYNPATTFESRKSEKTLEEKAEKIEENSAEKQKGKIASPVKKNPAVAPLQSKPAAAAIKTAQPPLTGQAHPTNSPTLPNQRLNPTTAPKPSAGGRL